jgi:hypothetical protein
METSGPETNARDGHAGRPISNTDGPLRTPHSDSGLWDAGTGSFHGSSLRRAIVARGWTAYEFSRMSKLNVGSVYNAIRGKAVRDATAIRIFETLEKRPPMEIALD